MILTTPSKVFAQFTLDKKPIHKEMLKRTIESEKYILNQNVLYEPVYSSQRIKHKYAKSFVYDASLIKHNININNYKQRSSSIDNTYEDELMVDVVSKFDKIYHHKDKPKPLLFHTKVKEFKLSKSNSCVDNNNTNNHLESNSNVFRKSKKNYNRYIKLQCFEYNELPLNEKLYNIIQKFKETNVKSIMLDKEIKNKFCRPSSYFNINNNYNTINTNNNNKRIINNKHNNKNKTHLKIKSSFSYSSTIKTLPLLLHHKNSYSHLSTISTHHSRKSSSSSHNNIIYKYVFT